jgi:glutathione gamma-glutamylcysteinyltransferase
MAGHAEPFFPLIEQFVTQDEPTFCGAPAARAARTFPGFCELCLLARTHTGLHALSPGLGSLTMVMNALGVDPRRRWRDETGPGWRWWSDTMFVGGACSPSLEELRDEGVSMDMLARLAATSGAEVSVHRPTDGGETLDSFRSDIISAARMEEEAFLVTSFDRASLGQTGGGHFSPIGAYHEESDSVLVLDVARFKYPPYFVALRDLWDASVVTDPATEKSRGWMWLAANEDVMATAPDDPPPGSVPSS